jgi:16S rRNA (guanine527-N7)-methyltransferase
VNFELDLKHELHLELSDEQKEQFLTYFDFLIEYNKITNLTRITEKMDVYYKHFFDSLSLVNVLNFNDIETICDMGAGAGFPSIPLKIIFPHLKVTIVDSLNKRITFLKLLIEKLHLDHIECYHARIEDFAVHHQSAYDVVTARALGHLSLILEMGIPMVKKLGYFIAPKGQQSDVEINEATQTMKQLGASLIMNKTFDLPHNYGQRANILFQKIKHVPGYPRTYTQMTNKPL